MSYEHIARHLTPAEATEPSGPDPRELLDYQTLREEIAKLESPALGQCNWARVSEIAERVLAISKDLSSATYLAIAMAEREGLPGLNAGMTLVAELLTRFEDVHPRRARARSSAATWYLERAERLSSSFDAKRVSRSEVQAVRDEIAKLRTALVDRLGGDAPSTGRLAESLDRLMMSVPEQVAVVATAAPASAPEARPEVQQASKSSPEPKSAPLVVPEAPEDLSKLPNHLLKLAASLGGLASRMRTEQGVSIESLRLALAALHLPVVQVPAVVRDGCTGLTAPPPAVRAEVDQLAGESDHGRAVDRCLRLLEKHRFYFDLHWMLRAHLPPDGAAVLECELRALAARLPGLTSARFSDGTPFVSARAESLFAQATRETSPQLAAQASSGNPRTESVNEATKRLLERGDVAGAMAAAQMQVESATSGRLRFQARLDLVAIALDARKNSVALALASTLYRECVSNLLSEWEPALAARCLELYLRAIATDTKTTEMHPRAEIFALLCRLDPRSASLL